MTRDSSTPPLVGRKALVTGGSRRLGRAIALCLGSAGASVAVHYRSDRDGAEETVALLEESRESNWGAVASLCDGDLTDEVACERLIEVTHESLGGIDILINNAAIFERTPLDAMTVADFDLHMAANARSVYALSLHAGRVMRAGDGGAIVNIADVAGHSPWPGYVPYSASKAAVINLTKGFAKALAPTVRANCIAPGAMLPPAGGADDQGEKAVAASLLKRWGSAEDIAHAALFLVRAEYLTGVVLNVDGGRSLV